MMNHSVAMPLFFTFSAIGVLTLRYLESIGVNPMAASIPVGVVSVCGFVFAYELFESRT